LKPPWHRVHARLPFAGLATILIGPAGCSFLVTPSAVQCEDDQDCTELGEGLVCDGNWCVVDPGTADAESGGTVNVETGGSQNDDASVEDVRWSCVDPDAMDPPPTELGDSNITYSITIADTLTQLPPPGLVVTACNTLDRECVAPVVDDIHPGPDGIVRAEVPINFAGFFRVLSDSTIPAMLYIDRPLVVDTVADAMFLIGELPFAALIEAEGLSVDPSLGHLLLKSFDCESQLAPGVSFTSDRGGTPFAFADGLPTPGETVTDAQGAGGFINVLPGAVIVKSWRADLDTQVGTASGHVRAGWFTYIDLESIP